MSDRPVVLLVTSNGTGMGHLTRQSAVARALGDRADTVVLSMSSGLPVVLDQGLRGEYLPSYQRPWVPRSDWHRYVGARVTALVRELGASVVAFDGVAPYRGLVQARRATPDVSWVWFRRGLWRPGVNAAALRAEPFFDVVLEPGDLAGAADAGPTAGRPAERVPPVSLLDVLDLLPREEAARALGLDPARPAALVTLGSGAVGDDRDAAAAAVEAVRAAGPQWQVATTRAVLSTDDGTVGEDVHVLRGVYPLAQYLSAFDLAVSAAGYNAVHELLPARLPTVLVPNRHTPADDQGARARELAARGLAVVAETPAEVGAAVAACLAQSIELRAATAEARCRGSQAAADALLRAASHPPAPSRSVRLERARYLARATVVDGVMGLLGERVAERLRAWRRARQPGLAHRMEVVLTEDPSPRADGRRTLLLTEHLDRDVVGRADPVEHVLPGTSPHYRAERVRIARLAYRLTADLEALRG